MNSRRFFVNLICLALLGAVIPLPGAARTSAQRGPVRNSHLDDADLDATRDLAAIGCGQVSMTISNFGVFGNVDQIPGYHGFEYPDNSGNDFLFSAGIWVGAIVNGEARVTTTTDGDNGTGEVWPIHMGTIPFQNINGPMPDYDWYFTSRSADEYGGKSYVLGAAGIDDDGDFYPPLDDRNGNSQPDRNWDEGSGWLGEDDDGDGLIDEEAADGSDNDGDGRTDEDTNSESDANGDGNCFYDPEAHVDEDPAGDIASDHVDNDHDGMIDSDDADFDGDANPAHNDDDNDGMTDEDAAAIADQELFTVFQDSISGQYVNNPSGSHVPLNMEVAQHARSWPGGFAANVILVDYMVRNRAALPLNQVYCAVFADPDIMAGGEGGDAGSTDDGNFYDPARLMMIQYDDTTDADGNGPGVFAIKLLHTDLPPSQLRFSFANFERISGGDPEFDVDKYALISSGNIAPPSMQLGDWRMLFAFGNQTTDGFTIPVGGTLSFTIAFIGAGSVAETRAVSDALAAAFRSGFEIEIPLPPVDFHKVATRSGEVDLGWNAPTDESVIGYHLYGTELGGIETRNRIGGLLSALSYTVSGLVNGDDWRFELTSVNSDSIESMPASVEARVAAPDPIQGLSAQNVDGDVRLQWQVAPEPDVVEYHVLRVEIWPGPSDSTYFTTQGSQYTDVTPAAGRDYAYQVAARNSINIAGRWSEAISITPQASPQHRLLVIDEYSHVVVGSVPNDSISARYQALLADLAIDYDYCRMPGCMAPESLAVYDRVLWFSENSHSNTGYDREEMFSRYVAQGGKLLRITRAFLFGTLQYPRGSHAGNVEELEPLQFDSVYCSYPRSQNPGMQFVGAQPEFAQFPAVAADTAHIHQAQWPESWHVGDYLPSVDTFWPSSETHVLYRSVVHNDDSSGLGSAPCGVYGHSQIFLSFPLYFLRYDDASALLSACLTMLDTMTTVVDEPLTSGAISSSLNLLPCYPNPFNPSTTLRFDLARGAFVRLEIYDILGRKLNDLLAENMQPGIHDVVWNGATNAGTEAATGLYFARLIAGAEVRTQKLLLLK